MSENKNIQSKMKYISLQIKYKYKGKFKIINVF